MVWVAWILMLLVVFPLLTLLHELGHALPALVFGAQDVTIVMGPRAGEHVAWRRQFGRLELVLTVWFPLFIGHVHTTEALPVRQRMQVILGGPLISLLLTIILVPLAYASRDASEVVRVLAQGSAAIAFFTLVMTSLPLTYPRWFYGYAGRPSDMQRLVQLWRSHNAE